MADDVFTVHGLSELDAALRELPLAVQTEIMEPALAAGGEVLRSGVVQRVPRRTGALAGGIEVQTIAAGDTGHALVGATTLAYRLRFVEFGTKAHVIVASALKRGGARTAGGKRALAGRGFGPRARVKHPATRAVAPLRRTLEEDGPRAVKAFAQRLWEGLRAYAERVPKGG